VEAQNLFILSAYFEVQDPVIALPGDIYGNALIAVYKMQMYQVILHSKK
jgi:hypothetical protein